MQKLQTMTDTPNKLTDVLFDPPALWSLLKEYFDYSGQRQLKPVIDQASLKEFLNTRASFVAQTTLYGYLRTRAGTRYPELFDDDYFVTSINIAKWQCWLACLSDLAVYTGGLLTQRTQTDPKQVANIIQNIVDDILQETGLPLEAGVTLADNADQVRQRIMLCQWQNISDDEQPFSHSPLALLEWAPVDDEFKEMDKETVINSVRFRWQKVRQDLREALDAKAIINNTQPEIVNV